MISDNFGKKKIYYGSMKSGKSSSLAREVERFNAYREKSQKEFDILIFKPIIDDRVLNEGDTETSVSTRDGKSFKAIPIRKGKEILKHVKKGKKQFIGIDEVMMLDSSIIEVLKELDKDPSNYIVLTGLDKSYRGDPFPFSDHEKNMYDLINLFEPEERYKIYGWCDKCGRENIGVYTQRYRKVNGGEDKELSKYYDPLIVIGDEEYESRCEKCFEKPPGKDKWLFIAIIVLKRRENEVSMDLIREGALKYGNIKESEFKDIIERMKEEKLILKDESVIKPTEKLEKSVKSCL